VKEAETHSPLKYTFYLLAERPKTVYFPHREEPKYCVRAPKDCQKEDE
jgi:hypothetical protein